MILANADIIADPELGSALAHHDGSTENVFAVRTFHAQSLGIAVATVAGTADAFLVGHFVLLLRPKR
jgi:hypothetical protein